MRKVREEMKKNGPANLSTSRFLSLGTSLSLTLITVALIIWLGIALMGYHQYVVTTRAVYEAKGCGDLIDLHPFSGWFKHSMVAIGIGIILSVAWLCLLFKRRVGLVVPLITIVSLALLATPYNPKVYATETQSLCLVNVLAVGDEEFMSDPSRMGQVEYAINLANSHLDYLSRDSFETTFNMSFRVRGWTQFHSDSQWWQYDLLLEAISEIGFIEGMNWNGWSINLLLVITGQETDGVGLSMPNWNATIIEMGYAVKPASYVIYRHEFSHQFWCHHCGNVCIMNLGDFFKSSPNWCSDCTEWIRQHRNKWVVPIHNSTEPLNQRSGYGGTMPLLY